ncbi:hypothetical protein DOY81_012978 [Sarcophaga bullata]|nr:hypothetical protein DOY81_012978 [Sarcophaga bullata]
MTFKPVSSPAANSSLASSFIMGEINADVLKTSVYSQFPSISMHSSAEEVVKLQNMVTENLQLKERKLSELLASNLDLKDVEKQYIDEINCLKVRLTSAEELIKSHYAKIAELVAKDHERLQKIRDLEQCIAEQTERIVLLEHQNEVHRKDFEIEKESRTVALKEKQQMLQDLKNLQKRNQELIEEHQKVADKYEKRLNSLRNSDVNPSYVSAAAAAQTYFNNPQRPIRNLPSPSNPQQPAAPIIQYNCAQYAIKHSNH